MSGFLMWCRLLHGHWVLPLLLFVQCGSAPARFARLANPEPESSQLYLYRPFQSVLAWTNIEIDLLQYSGGFADSTPRRLESFELDNGEYVMLRLAPGYYAIQLPGNPRSRKVLFLKKNDVAFRSVEYRSGGFFSFPETLIFSRTKEEALGELLRHGRMIKNPRSAD